MCATNQRIKREKPRGGQRSNESGASLGEHQFRYGASRYRRSAKPPAAAVAGLGDRQAARRLRVTVEVNLQVNLDHHPRLEIAVLRGSSRATRAVRRFANQRSRQ